MVHRQRKAGGALRIQTIQFAGRRIHVVRDDLYPAYGGGNKARKLDYIVEDVVQRRCNALVSTGGVQSNHCRAVAMAAATQGWKCTLVIHGDSRRFYAEGGNARLIRLSGAEVVFVDANSIAEAMDDAVESYRKRGYRPYYVRGGGHGLPGTMAYVEGVRELYTNLQPMGLRPDYIFHASGTGSTQAGILSGLDALEVECEVIGISVARDAERAQRVVAQSYREARDHMGLTGPDRNITVLDNYTGGGYEQVIKEVTELIPGVAKQTGIYLDPTYTGKAFWGMLEYAAERGIPSASHIFFWHTGGMYNLMASDLF